MTSPLQWRSLERSTAHSGDMTAPVHPLPEMNSAQIFTSGTSS
jgi:hypothetical protein